MDCACLVHKVRAVHWLLHKRCLRTANQIDNWTIFSRAETRSLMKMHVSEKQTYKKH